MKDEAMLALAKEFAKNLKTEADLNNFSKALKKLTVETALNAELTEHLGYEKNSPRIGKNTRNGYTTKRLFTDDGEFELDTPRDRDGTFEPQLIKKSQTRITQMDSQILSLYAKGMTTRDIVATFKEMYDADVSPTLISKVTDAVKEQVIEWQNRPLDALYPIVYMDCIVVKVRQDSTIINKAVYLALGVNTDGQKDLLGMWMSENEGSKFWLSVLTELKNRGLKDILIACLAKQRFSGLKGFPEAIAAIYPQTEIQLCIVHQIRNSLRYVASKDQKAFMADLKPIYRADTKGAAEVALDELEEKWGEKYGVVIQSWRTKWHLLSAYFKYPKAIRKPIYTTNAVEAVHRQFRKLTKTKGAFPNEDSLMKLLYIGIQQASEKWTMPIQEWGQTITQLSIYFEGRLDDIIKI